ncbi:MAG: hypothetical protein EXX96DRAFT_103890 [Benjaminiella poitrasii]|nr:MAG: hypothetical protein EXX96DRAFT_103890 [Benjaminiella poitrasii]
MKSVERLHVYNLQGYSLTANRFYIDLCMKLKETLTLFEILSTATFDAVIKYYGSIYYFIRKLPNLQNLRIVINAYAPIIAYPDVSLSTLLDESKGLKTIELEGFSLIQCDKKSLTDDSNKNNSLRQLKIRTWSLQFSVLKFIISRCNKLDNLSIHTCVDTKIDDDEETDSSSGIEILQEFSYFLEDIKTVYVDFRIDGHQITRR